MFFHGVAKPLLTTVLVIQAGLVTNSYVGMGNNGTGCFTTGTGVSLGIAQAATLRCVLCCMASSVQGFFLADLLLGKYAPQADIIHQNVLSLLFS